MTSYSPSFTSSSTSSSPTAARRRPEALRLTHIGCIFMLHRLVTFIHLCPSIDPSEIIGKVLRRARQSSTHPTITLDFADHTTVQVLVDGYDPVHRGIPKQLEMDDGLDAILSANKSLNLEVIDCAFVTLQDVAFDCKYTRYSSKAVSWEQKHLGLALKFSEKNPRWHCIWACMEERHEKLPTCVFRSYDDVYLEKLHRTPRKNKWPKSSRQDIPL